MTEVITLMKIFKRVYYPILAALVVLMLVLGMVDSRVGMSGGNLADSKVNAAFDYAVKIAQSGGEENRPHNSYDAEAHKAVRDYIETELVKAGAILVESGELDDDGNNTAEYSKTAEGKNRASLYVQKTKVRQDSQNGDEIAAEREVENLILAIPGESADAILLHARYDSAYLGGAADASATGALLQTAADMLASNAAPKNTVVFLFGDAGQEGDLGACAFVNQFAGFDNVAKNVRAAGDFRVGGTGGTLMLYGGNDGPLGVMNKYASFNGSALASSALEVLASGGNNAGNKAFGDYGSLVFDNRGGFNDYATSDDVTVNKNLVSQQANAMSKFVECFANSSLGDIKSDVDGVYFSYLDVLTVSYSNTVAYVIAGVIAAMLIAAAIVNMRTKAFSWGKTLAGAAVQLVAILGSMLVMLGLYYLFALLLCGFGVLPFQGLSSIKFAGGGLFVSASIMAITIAVFFYIILKRTFAVRAADVVRGNTVLFAVAAVILSFAAPAISYPFTCAAIFSLAAMIATAAAKNKFKAKFGMDIDRLFLYVWAAVFTLPVAVPVMFAAQTLFPAVSIVVLMAFMIALAGFVAPFADYLKPVLDKAFKKLPERTVRYERMVTEKVEDRAKKGKFTEVTSKKIIKEKTPWNYLNRIGLVTVCVIASVMIMLFSSFSTSFSSSALDAPSYYDSIYNDSLVYVYDGSAVTVEVHDRIAYDYIRYAVGDLKWDAEKNAYVKSYNGSASSLMGGVTPSIGDAADGEISFSTIDLDKSQITVRLKNASAVKKVSFREAGQSADGMEYEFNNEENVTFRLPYGYELASMKIEGSCTVEFEQHVFNDRNLPASDNQTEDWQKLSSYAKSNPEEGITPHSGIVIKLTKSV